MQKTGIPLYESYEPGNYRLALREAARKLSETNPGKAAERSGCPFDSAGSRFMVTCLGHPFTVSYPDGQVRYSGSDLQPPVALQLPMINYLSRADGTPLSYSYIPYRSLEWGGAYYDAFMKTAVKPLKEAFGPCPDSLLEAAAHFDGSPYSKGNGTGVMLFLLPRVPLIFLVWSGDDEFPPGANILFDKTANHYLHTEDLAAVDVVTRLLIKNKPKK